MLMVMNEISMASIVATAGQNNFVLVLWLRCLSPQAFIPKVDGCLVQIVVLVQRFVALYWQRSGLGVGTLVTLRRSMIQYGR